MRKRIRYPPWLHELLMLLFVPLLFCPGCRSTVSDGFAWYKPNKTYEECQQDFLECHYDVVKAIYKKYGYVRSGTIEGFERMVVCGTCMKERGYGLIPVEQLPVRVTRAKTSYGSWEIAGK